MFDDREDADDEDEPRGLLFSRRTMLLGSAVTAISTMFGTQLREEDVKKSSVASMQPGGTNEVVFGYGGAPLPSIETTRASSTATPVPALPSTSRLDLPTVDTTRAGDASFSGSSGDYTLEGSGVDVWTDHDDYAAVYEDDVSGDVVARVTVERQANTHPWAKAGLLVANDITAPGSSKGDLILATTPENGYALQWDDDGDGYVDTSKHEGSVSYPATLRLTKSGTEFTGAYSTDGGSTWTTVGSVTIPEANSTQDIGVFLRGSKTDVRGTAEFGGFQIR